MKNKTINTIIIRLVLFMLMLTPVVAYAQADRQFIRNGNSYFRNKQYDKAEVEYRKAIGKNNENATAVYNLGCALQAQKKDSLALIQYDLAGSMEKDAARRSQIFYNMGTVYHGQKQLDQAIKAYKQALRDNPHDEDARYNLALAKKQRQQQQQQQQQQQNQNQQNQDKDQNKDKDKKQQDQNKDKPNQPKKDQQQEQMDKDNAEQLLNAAMQEEKATQQKLKKHMQQQGSRSLEKNW